MKSLIISGVVSASKKLAKRFKSSKLGALIDNLHAGFGRSWNKSIITGFLIFISGNIMNFGFISFTPLVVGVYLVPVLVLPLVLLIYNLIKRRKNNEKTA